MLPINFVSIAVAGCVAFVIGFLLHGPVGGKLWMKLANIVPTGKEKFSTMIPQMLANLIMNFVTAFALFAIYSFMSTSVYFGITGAWGGVLCAMWVWLGFVVAGSSMEVIWMGRSMKLWLYECMCSLITMGAMGAIVAVW